MSISIVFLHLMCDWNVPHTCVSKLLLTLIEHYTWQFIGCLIGFALCCNSLAQQIHLRYFWTTGKAGQTQPFPAKMLCYLNTVTCVALPPQEPLVVLGSLFSSSPTWGLTFADTTRILGLETQELYTPPFRETSRLYWQKKGKYNNTGSYIKKISTHKH